MRFLPGIRPATSTGGSDQHRGRSAQMQLPLTLSTTNCTIRPGPAQSVGRLMIMKIRKLAAGQVIWRRAAPNGEEFDVKLYTHQPEGDAPDMLASSNNLSMASISTRGLLTGDFQFVGMERSRYIIKGGASPSRNRPPQRRSSQAQSPDLNFGTAPQQTRSNNNSPERATGIPSSPGPRFSLTLRPAQSPPNR